MSPLMTYWWLDSRVYCDHWLFLQHENHHLVVLNPAACVSNARKNLDFQSDTHCAAPDSRDMAKRTIYTRVYSKRSAGRFISCKGPKGGPLFDASLIKEFRNHAKFQNHGESQELTALVSGSDRIIDTLRRAFDKHYRDGESAADIWIAFLGVPPTPNRNTTRIHSAK
jgi:hypothetical protein